MQQQKTFHDIVANLVRRIRIIELREVMYPAVSTISGLPVPSTSTLGRLRFVSNGRKVGEGAGAGTGTIAYDDGIAWRRVGDDTTVVA